MCEGVREMGRRRERGDRGREREREGEECKLKERH